MTVELHRIRIAPDSELARFLEAGGETPVLLEANGRLFRLTDENKTTLWADYDPDKARAALQDSTDTLRGVDRDELLADIHAQRAQDTSGRAA